MNKRFSYGLLLVAIVVFFAHNATAAPQNSAVEEIVVQLKWHHQFQFAGFYAAKELGYYRDAGLNVTIKARQFDQSVLDQVLSGNAQFGVADATLVMHRLKGLPVVALLANYKYSPLVLITRKSDNIINPVQLKNKRIMYQRNTDDSALLALFKKFNLKRSDINYVEMRKPQQALENNLIDAYTSYITNQPFLHHQRGFAVNLINPANYGIDLVGDLTYTSEAYIKEHRQQVADFRAATIRGWQYALGNPEQVIDWIINIYHSPKSKVELLNEAKISKTLFDPDLTTLGAISSLRLDNTVHLYKELKLVSSTSNLEGFDFESYSHPKLTIWQFVLITLIIFLTTMVMIFYVRRPIAGLAKSIYGFFSKTALVEAKHQHMIEQHILSYRTDKDDCFVFVSPAFCQKIGYSSQELMGRRRNYVYHRKFASSSVIKITKSIEQWLPWSGEIMYQSKQGDVYWHRTQLDPIVKNEYLLGYSAIEYDISDKKRLEQSSVVDAGTGLFNHFRIEQLIHYERNRSIRTNYPFSVLLLNLDGLSIILEKEGQQLLDDFLLDLANIVNNEIRISDTAGRWAHNKLLVVCPETNTEGVNILSLKISAAIERFEFKSPILVQVKIATTELKNKEEIASLIKRVEIKIA